MKMSSKQYPSFCIDALHLACSDLGFRLACVLDYLFDFVTPGTKPTPSCLCCALSWLMDLLAFDDIAAHDFYWGACRVEYGGDMTDTKRSQLQAIIAQGLPKIHPLLFTNDYVRRDWIVNPGVQGPASLSGWLFLALAEVNCALRQDQDRRQFCEDTDSGPSKMWYTIQLCVNFPRYYYNRRYINKPELLLDRRWGYVMWNCQRFQTRDNGGQGFLPFSRTRYGIPHVFRQPPCNQFWSWVQRAKLYKQGWRGRWNGKV